MTDEELEREAEAAWVAVRDAGEHTDSGRYWFRRGYIARATEEAAANADRAKRGAELVSRIRNGLPFVQCSERSKDAAGALDELAALLESTG